MAHPYAGSKGGSKLLASVAGGGAKKKQAATHAIESEARNTRVPTIGVSNLTPDGKKPGARMDRFARGGRVGPTTNIIIATGGKDQGQGQMQGPMPAPMGAPPVAPPPMPMAGPRPAPLGMPPGPPPGAGMKFGGRFKRGGKVAHPDEAQDRKLIKKMLREEEASERKGFKRGGAVKAEDSKRVAHVLGRKDGGRVPHMTAGAESGEGRLQKTALQKRVK